MTERSDMWESSRRRRGPECLSDRAIDRLLTAEAPAAEQARAQAHFTACAACAEAQRSLREDQASFLAREDVSALAAAALARAPGTAVAAPAARAGFWSWRRLVPALGLGVAAAGALVVVPNLARRAPSGSLDGPAPIVTSGTQAQSLRAKGALAVALYVKHGERTAGQVQVGALHLGEALHPGDQVRLAVSSARGGHLAVLGVDAAGQVSVYYPVDADVTSPSRPSSADADVGPAPLPGAIELDGTLGKEVIVALECSQPQRLDQVVSATRRALDPARVGRDPGAALGRLALPCAEARYAIDKVAAARAPAP